MSTALVMTHRVLALLVLVQAVFAGGFISGGDATFSWHSMLGQGLPVLSAVVVVWAWIATTRGGCTRGRAIWVTVNAALVWVVTGLGFIPAAWATSLHIPLAVALFGLLLLLAHPARTTEVSQA